MLELTFLHSHYFTLLIQVILDMSHSLKTSQESQKWLVRRRSSTEIKPRISRTNSANVSHEAAFDSESDSCFSEIESDVEDEAEAEFNILRRHSVPSLHPSADLDMVKFLVRPSSGLPLKKVQYF